MTQMKMTTAAMIVISAVAATTLAQGRIRNDAPRPSLDVPRVVSPPAMDASPDDLSWTEAATIHELTLSLNAQATSEPQKTQVRLLWSPAALYVRFVCIDGEPFAPHTGRDRPHHEGDVVEVFIDPVGDARQWYEVQVSPTNQVLDALTLMTGEPESDDQLILTRAAARDQWTFIEGFEIAGLATATQMVPGGWIADVTIPASALTRRRGGGPLSPGSMRINLLRYDRPFADNGKRQFVPTNWAPVLAGNPHRSPKAMGVIRLIDSAE
jgi:hypothetical protein